jgi:hypothetical protein
MIITFLKMYTIIVFYGYNRNFSSCISGMPIKRNLTVKENPNENKIYDANNDLKLPDNVTSTEESSAYFIIELIKKIWCYFFKRRNNILICAAPKVVKLLTTQVYSSLLSKKRVSITY